MTDELYMKIIIPQMNLWSGWIKKGAFVRSYVSAGMQETQKKTTYDYNKSLL